MNLFRNIDLIASKDKVTAFALWHNRHAKLEFEALQRDKNYALQYGNYNLLILLLDPILAW